MTAGKLRDRVTFGEMAETVGAGGVVSTAFTERHTCAAQLIYTRGSETVEAARLEGRAIFKVKIRSCAAARAIATDWRMRDVRRGTEYAIAEVDPVTDPVWVYIVVEGGNET